MSTYYIAGFPISDELYHHGIKGQKWGIRRYQNEDGTLTAAGKARYGTTENFNNARAAKAAQKEYGKAFNKALRGNIAYLSPVKRHREKQNQRWNDANEKAKASNKADAAYKKSKASVQKIPEVQARKAKIKKGIIIGASVAATALAAYGGYRLAKDNPELVTYGKYKLRQVFGKNKNTPVTPDWSDREGDDSISRMAKAGLRDIENRHASRTPTNMSDIRSRGSNDAFERLRDKALNASNAVYEERLRSSEAAARREQELGRERRAILDRQFQDTYNILREEERQMRQQRRGKNKPNRAS